MKLNSRQRRFIWIDQGAIIGLATGVITWLITSGTMWLTGSDDRLRLFAGLLEGPVASDVAMTAFFLPFFTCLIASPFARRDVRSKQIAPINQDELEPRILRRLPRSGRGRGLVLGLIGLLVVAPLIVGVLAAVGFESIDAVRYAWLKSLATIPAALVVGVVNGLLVLATCDESR